MVEEPMEQIPVAAPYADVGARLKTAMLRKGITGSLLAHMLSNEGESKDSISAQAVSKWTRGEGLPSASRMEALSRLLDVSQEYLLGDHEPSKPGRKPGITAQLALRGHKPLIDATYASREKKEASDLVDSLGSEWLFKEYGFPGLSPAGREKAIAGEAKKLAARRASLWVEERRSRDEILAALQIVLIGNCESRRDSLIVDSRRNISGGYYRSIVDLVVSEDVGGINKLKLGVLIEVGLRGEKLPGLVGDALNWAIGTNNLPLYIVWLVPKSSLRPIEAELERVKSAIWPLTTIRPEIGFSLVAGFSVIEADKVGGGFSRVFGDLSDIIATL